MPIQQVLLGFDELHSFHGLDTFTQNIPVEWIESALCLTAAASIRRRRLPPEQVLWLVTGMALFRNESIGEVARRLNICSQGLANDDLLARSGISEARQRLSDKPLEWLFKITTNAIPYATPGSANERPLSCHLRYADKPLSKQ